MSSKLSAMNSVSDKAMAILMREVSTDAQRVVTGIGVLMTEVALYGVPRSPSASECTAKLGASRAGDERERPRMSERTFTYTWTDAKRLTVLHALGFMYAKLQVAPASVHETVRGLIGELSTVPGMDFPLAPTPDPEANMRAPLSPPFRPPAPRDYFQPTKRGKEVTQPPEGADLNTVTIVSVKKLKMDAKYWTVIYVPDGVEQEKFIRASCWDASLADKLSQRERQSVEVWIMESGNYLNIVGVRA